MRAWSCSAAALTTLLAYPTLAQSDLDGILRDEMQGLTPQARLLTNQDASICLHEQPLLQEAHQSYWNYRNQGYTLSEAAEASNRSKHISWWALEYVAERPTMEIQAIMDQWLRECIHDAAVRNSTSGGDNR